MIANFPGHANRLVLSTAAACSLALAIILNPGVTHAQGTQAVQGAIGGTDKQAVIKRAAALINNLRARLDACGEEGMLAANAPHSATPDVPVRPSLTWNPHLAEAARRHSEAMARDAFFDHLDPQGRTVGARVTRIGYRWRVVGENLAAGHTNIDEAVSGWLLSTGHCKVMLDARFTEFGLARVDIDDPADPYGSYWTLVVARPKQGDTLNNPPAMAMLDY